MIKVLKTILVIGLIICLSNGEDETTEVGATPRDEVNEITEETERQETTTDGYATTEVVQLNGTDSRKPKNYYVYSREPVRNRGSIKYSNSRWQNRIREEPHVRKPNPRPSESIKRRKPISPVYESQYKVEESAESIEDEDSLPLSSIINPVMVVSPNINDTVFEVERILNAHPELPKLTREEIIGYINNITESENDKPNKKNDFVMDAKESENNGGEIMEEESESKAEDGSLMVVLPYKPNEEENLEELYTRSPIVKIVQTGNDFGDKIKTQENEPRVTTYAPKFNMEEFQKSKSDSQYSQVLKENHNYNPPLRVIGYRLNRDDKTTTETYGSTTESYETATKSYTNYDDIELVTKKFKVSDSSIAGNHKLPEIKEQNDTKFDYEPNKTSSFFNLPDTMDTFGVEDAIDDEKPQHEEVETKYSSKYSTTTTKPTTTLKPRRKSNKRKTTSTTAGPPDLSSVMEILPSDMKDLLMNIGLNDKNKDMSRNVPENLPALKVPQPTIDPMSYLIFKPLPVMHQQKKEKTINDDMKDFLASFGLFPNDNFRQSKALNSTKNETAQAPAPAKSVVDPGQVPEINPDILPEDMKYVLSDLGLTKNVYKKQSRIHIFNPNNHSINQSEEETKKLNALLITIRKLVTLNDTEPITPQFQNEIIQQIKDLDNLTKKYKNINSSVINDEIKKIMAKNKEKFNFVPLVSQQTTTKKNNRLKSGPDPLTLTDIDLLKNEVKRQQASSSSSSSSSNSAGNGNGFSFSSSSSSSSSSSNGESTATSSATSSGTGSASSSATASSDSGETEAPSTEEAPNIQGLKESFGGGETAPDDADVESSLPPKKPNGLYLLLDWNSFLEVGTPEDSRRVNIRFQPKIGDARNFLPVTIP